MPVVQATPTAQRAEQRARRRTEAADDGEEEEEKEEERTFKRNVNIKDLSTATQVVQLVGVDTFNRSQAVAAYGVFRSRLIVHLIMHCVLDTMLAAANSDEYDPPKRVIITEYKGLGGPTGDEFPYAKLSHSQLRTVLYNLMLSMIPPEMEWTEIITRMYIDRTVPMLKFISDKDLLYNTQNAGAYLQALLKFVGHRWNPLIPLIHFFEAWYLLFTTMDNLAEHKWTPLQILDAFINALEYDAENHLKMEHRLYFGSLLDPFRDLEEFTLAEWGAFKLKLLSLIHI